MITKDQFLKNVNDAFAREARKSAEHIELTRKAKLAEGIAKYYGYRVVEPSHMSNYKYELMNENGNTIWLTLEEFASLIEPATKKDHWPVGSGTLPAVETIIASGTFTVEPVAEFRTDLLND